MQDICLIDWQSIAYVLRLEEVAEESAGGFIVHPSTCRVIFELFPADASDFRITGFRMHEYHTADTCLRYHRTALSQLDSEIISTR